MKKAKIILASKSPRRSELLNLIHLDFEVKPSSIDESKIKASSALNLVKALAEAKAKDVFDGLEEDSLVIAADTIVVIEKAIEGLGRLIGNSTILEKPTDKEHAKKMLEALSNQSHLVITGFSLLSKSFKVSKAVSTEVTFRDLSEGEINYYINLDEPYDKAGGYGIQGYAQVFISSIKGSYTNVVGLPISELIQEIPDVYRE